MTHSPEGSALSTPCLAEGAVDTAAVVVKVIGSDGAAVVALVGNRVAVGFSLLDGLGVEVDLGMVSVGIGVISFAVAAAGTGVTTLAAEFVVLPPLPQAAIATAANSETTIMRIEGRSN